MISQIARLFKDGYVLWKFKIKMKSETVEDVIGESLADVTIKKYCWRDL